MKHVFHSEGETGVWRFPARLNPEGIAALSPGLRAASYPGFDRSKESPTLKGLRHATETAEARRKPVPCCNPFRVEHGSGRQPRVARGSQPWAVGYNPFRIAATVGQPQRSQRTQSREPRKGLVFIHQMTAAVRPAACLSLCSLHCNSRTCSQAARIWGDELPREAFGVRGACSRFRTDPHFTTAPASWTHSKRFAQFDCGSAALCSLWLN